MDRAAAEAGAVIFLRRMEWRFWSWLRHRALSQKDFASAQRFFKRENEAHYRLGLATGMRSPEER